MPRSTCVSHDIAMREITRIKMAAMSAKFKISRVGRTISRWVADDEIIKKEHLKVKLASEYALAELCMLIAICDRMVDHPPTYAEAKHNSHDRQALELDVQTARALDALTRLGNKLERLGQLSGCSNMELYEAE